MKISFVTLAMLAACLSVAQPVSRSFRPFLPKEKNEIVAGQLLVKTLPSKAAQLRLQADLPGATSAESQLVPGGMVKSRIGQSGWTLWEIPVVSDPAYLAKEVMKRPGVLHAQPVNKIYPLLATPNDPDWNYIEESETYILSFSEDPISFRRLWHMADTFAHEGWSVWPNRYFTAANKPANAPLIAVIDTGNDMNHPDFRNAGGAGTDISQGGQLVHSLSKQFRFGEIDAGGTAMDSNGHGTHVAGIALASANNGAHLGMGTIGTGYMARGMVLRVFDSSGSGTDADAAAAMYYAADQGADIINLSLGTINFSQLFQDASTYAFQKGTLVVAAANEAGDGGGLIGPIYPAACSGVFAVTANGPDYGSAANTYSGAGQYVDMAAPGGDVVQGTDYYILQYIYSTSPTYQVSLNTNPNVFPPFGTDYTYLLGTSMACPTVSGGVSAWYDKHNVRQGTGWANIRAYQALQRSAYGVAGAPNGGWEPYQGYGNLDIESLLDPQYDNWRGATVGAVEGTISYNGTVVNGVAVRARRVVDGVLTGVTFSTTSQPDGSYRFDQLPSFDGDNRVYEVWASPFGVTKRKRTVIIPGSDQTGFDFLCLNNGFTMDETDPVVAKFNVVGVRGSVMEIDHFTYDTETGLDSGKVSIGTTLGAANILAPTEVWLNNNIAKVPVPALRSGQTYYVRGTYTNGDGDVKNIDRKFVYLLPDYDAEVVTFEASPDVHTPGQAVPMAVTVKNTGTQPWSAGGSRSFHLVPVSPSASEWNLAPVALPAGTTVKPGSTYTFNFTRPAPASAGAWRVAWRMRVTSDVSRSTKPSLFGETTPYQFPRVN